MTLTLQQFWYDLPPTFIAQTPKIPRDTSRLLVLDRYSGKIKHSRYRDLADFLQPGDVLVRNNTKVIPARLFGHKHTGGKVELLLSKLLTQTVSSCTWEVLSKPGLKLGQVVQFGSQKNKTELSATCTFADPQLLTRQLKFDCSYPQLLEMLAELGHTPLPPYMHHSTEKADELSKLYQTIYAKKPGSSAAPTAGLHFTPELEQKLQVKGVEFAEITLHAGLGTFLSVKTELISDHHMHSEWFELTSDVAEQLNRAKANDQRIIAVGTTTTRVLESCSDDVGQLKAQSGETDIFIYPPYKYKFVDGLITNFHLPETTLLMLVAAFVSAPNTKQTFKTFLESAVGQAYQTAIKENYRFYSFGDGMLIV